MRKVPKLTGRIGYRRVARQDERQWPSCNGHGPQLARRARRLDAPTEPLSSKLVRCRPEDIVNAIQPWEDECKAHSTNFVSSPHFTSTRLYMIRRYAGERPTLWHPPVVHACPRRQVSPCDRTGHGTKGGLNPSGFVGCHPRLRCAGWPRMAVASVCTGAAQKRNVPAPHPAGWYVATTDGIGIRRPFSLRRLAST